MARKFKFPKSVVAFVEGLYADCLHVESIDKNWSTGFDLEGDGDGWRFWEAVECDKCGEVIVRTCGSSGDAHNEVDSDSECDGYVSGGEGPMMNFWYPLNDSRLDAEAAAKKIADLPLCVVEVDGQYGLALTGGGMDLSWEICEAFTRLGQCPPLAFCTRLPRMAGLKLTPQIMRVLAASRKSVEVEVSRMARAVDEVDKLIAELPRPERKATKKATAKKTARKRAK